MEPPGSGSTLASKSSLSTILQPKETESIHLYKEFQTNQNLSDGLVALINAILEQVEEMEDPSSTEIPDSFFTNLQSLYVKLKESQLDTTAFRNAVKAMVNQLKNTLVQYRFASKPESQRLQEGEKLLETLEQCERENKVFLRELGLASSIERVCLKSTTYQDQFTYSTICDTEVSNSLPAVTDIPLGCYDESEAREKLTQQTKGYENRYTVCMGNSCDTLIEKYKEIHKKLGTPDDELATKVNTMHKARDELNRKKKEQSEVKEESKEVPQPKKEKPKSICRII